MNSNTNRVIEDVLYDYCIDSISDELLRKEYEKADSVLRYKMYCDGRIPDPDTSSVELQRLYSNGSVWDVSQEKRPYMWNKGWICSDTMTSVSSSINAYLKMSSQEEINGEKIAEIKNRINGQRGQYSKTISAVLYEMDPEKYKSIVSPFNRLLKLHHTIGNYCPVSRGFNAPRSGCGHYDYWDITLQKIFEYYSQSRRNTFEELILKELLHNKGDGDACRKWLDSFGKGIDAWKRFVEEYCMEDYLDQSGFPKPFFIDHSWKNHGVEANNSVEFAEEVSGRICRRGVRVIAKHRGINLRPEDVSDIADDIMKTIE